MQEHSVYVLHNPGHAPQPTDQRVSMSDLRSTVAGLDPADPLRQPWMVDLLWFNGRIEIPLHRGTPGYERFGKQMAVSLDFGGV